ncbi:MAG: site-specific DNA-methyltransferase [Ilumatobacteraceae bacterium]
MSPADLNRILIGDARAMLGQLPDSSVDCVVTSPPYFRLRNYQHDQQIGLEPSVDGWVDELRLVARGLKRVLKPTGTFWLNLGDTYARHARDGAPPKSLLLGPERLALALVADGWVLRNKVIWSKPNPMPTSIRDRLSCTWEVVYCFAQARSYFYDLDAIRIPHRSHGRSQAPRQPPRPAWRVPPGWRAPLTGSNNGLGAYKASGLPGHPLGKNPGDVWTIPTAAYRGAHHAVYPERLVERILHVACPPIVCISCGQPWRRQRHRIIEGRAVSGAMRTDCGCGTSTTTPGVVLDPFIGAGTTAVVAERLHRHWLGIELNPDFAAQANARIKAARTLTTEQPEAAAA